MMMSHSDDGNKSNDSDNNHTTIDRSILSACPTMHCTKDFVIFCFEVDQSNDRCTSTREGGGGGGQTSYAEYKHHLFQHQPYAE